MAELMSVRGITKAHAGRPILRGIDLEVRPGEVLGLIGANGAGKSTLMSIISGAYKPDAGTMVFEGEPYDPMDTSEARAMGIGIIEQNFKLDGNLTVAQAIYRNTYQADRPHSALRRQAQWLLNEAGVHVSPDARVGHLLRPEVGLVEAVRLLADDAQIVLVDEVAATFNVREIQDLHFITSRLTRQGRSVVYISHRLHEVKDITNRIAVLRDGEIVEMLKSSRTTTEAMAQAMFGKIITRSKRQQQRSEEVVLRAKNLRGDTLKGVDFSLHRGEVIALVGPRHSGIPDIVGAITGDRPGTFDELEVFGQARTIRSPEDAAALRITYFSEDDAEFGLDSDESIARSLMAGGWSDGMDFNDEVAALRDIIGVLSQFQVKAKTLFGDVNGLSGGDQQKIALAKFMSEDCDIMILNEPTRGLDMSSRHDVHKMLSELTESGKSAILLSTDYEDALDWSDRVLVVRDGRIWREVRSGDATADQLTLWCKEAERPPRRVWEDDESTALAKELIAEQEADRAQHQAAEEELDRQIAARASRALF
ncbi:MAG: sugar ABC transporter ATP-binding protein [Actinomycetia bacterium]|nr:sugar ABC transporter ATP-binding protein [Actinomycetes bacterium]